MDAFITRRGGAGGGLNFKVVGGTNQPSNPKENTIWVDTDQEITEWVFSAEEPSEPLTGMVCILTGVSSNTEFNALKKNAIQIYPLSAKQYNGNEWVSVSAKAYQNGEWVDWIAWLFKNGDQYNDKTGGWGLHYTYTSTSDNFSGHYGIVSDGIKIGIPAQNKNTWVALEYATKNKIDVTQYKTLSFRVVSVSLTSGIESKAFGLIKGTSPNYANMAASAAPTKVGEYEIDISNISGSYYIGGHISSVAENSPAGYFVIDDVALR